MRLGALLVTIALAAGLLAAVPGTAEARRPPADRPAVIEKRIIGRTVGGRPIPAYHLGQSGYPRVVLIATMHGDESRTRLILRSLRDGRPIRRLNLWVVPVYNPDGLARGTRKNVRGVDLNRNYPYRWADLDGDYESGPRPGSEPETRAMMRFLRDVRPRWLISFHQPLYGVDTDTKSPRFSRRVARHLNLPRKSFTCGGVCRGTMTGWYNANFTGVAITVEYGGRPPRRLMTKTAPRQVLGIWDAFRR
ncbi:hypothetical protein GCM10027062_28490 [Nocardioides hungaricus]